MVSSCLQTLIPHPHHRHRPPRPQKAPRRWRGRSQRHGWRRSPASPGAGQVNHTCGCRGLAAQHSESPGACCPGGLCGMGPASRPGRPWRPSGPGPVPVPMSSRPMGPVGPEGSREAFPSGWGRAAGGEGRERCHRSASGGPPPPWTGASGLCGWLQPCARQAGG